MQLSQIFGSLISPSFTPDLGTPSSGILTNCTGLPQAGVTGLTTSDSPVFGTVKLSGLTDGYIPKHTSDAVGLVNSPIYTDGTNVGIGTNNPAVLVDIRSNSPSGTSTIDLVHIYDDRGYAPENINTGKSLNIEGWFGNSDDTGSLIEATAIQGGTYVSRLVVKGYSGNVGVCTTTPASKLSVLGNLSVGATYANIAAPTSGAIFEGNVGIGTTSPQAKLHVAGDILTSGPSLQINTSGSGNRFAWIDLVGDDTYTDFGLRIIRNNTGANAISDISHRGTGILQFSTVDAANIKFQTSNADRVIITSSGIVGIGTNDPTAMLDINSDTLRLRTAKTPASATAAGNQGDICWNSTYMYVCVATNTWRRIPHSSW